MKNGRTSDALSETHQPSRGVDGELRHLGEKLSRLRSAFLSAPIALCLIDDQLRYVEVNERMAVLNGRPIEEHIGRVLREIVPDIADEIEPLYGEIFATGRSMEHRLLSEQKGDGKRYVLVNYNPVKDETGKTVLVSVSVLDVTSEKKAQEEANAAAQRLLDVLESTSDSVILLAADGRITYINRHAELLFAPQVPTLGATLPQIILGWVASGAARRLAAIDAARETARFEEFLQTLDRWLEFDVFPTADGLSLFIRDVSDRRCAQEEERRAQERIAFLATHDALTGLSNRSAFYDSLDSLLAGMPRDRALVLLYLELDGFKAVNDTMGHPAGDAVLVAFSDRLRPYTEESGVVARFSGNDFIIVKAHQGSPSDIEAFAETLISSLSQGFEVDGEPVAIGVRIGIAFAMRGATSDEVVRQANVALSAAKATGHNSYCFFEPGMGDELLLRQLYKRELAQALRRNELAVEFQPIVDMKTGRLAAFETLVRWRHPSLTDVNIEYMIGIAEETGLIHPIGEWVLQQACKEAANWPGGVLVAVNVSVLQIRDRRFSEMVRRVLAETGVSPTHLTLEITETVPFVGEKLATDTLEELRRHGVRISLDDFGKGYTSLQYLKKLTVDTIKIDQSFVLDAQSNFASLAILRAVVILAQALGIATVAEGIERASQYELLRLEGCEFGQGFFLGRPMSPEDCRRLLERQNDVTADRDRVHDKS